MYPITIQSGTNEYLLGEVESFDEDVISKLPIIIKKCLIMYLLY
jgi:hypothetical protein